MSWCGAVIAVSVGAVFLVDFNCVTGELRQHCPSSWFWMPPLLYLCITFIYFRPFYLKMETQCAAQPSYVYVFAQWALYKETLPQWFKRPFSQNVVLDYTVCYLSDVAVVWLASCLEGLIIVRRKTDCFEFLRFSSQMWDITTRLIGYDRHLPRFF
jgi:hypothetical protein